ncbi:terminase small subunit [Acetobacter indonesiensis]|uniref:terminase small subunit n=1 Tax=Acetobacter indonesiensis TaxID=104101 RepID=UPI000A04330B|nr:terminase small subunit [Acetobacter indonesiensis]
MKKHEIERVSLLSNVKVAQAAIRAGYSEKTAGRIGSENLQKLDIQNAISEAAQGLIQPEILIRTRKKWGGVRSTHKPISTFCPPIPPHPRMAHLYKLSFVVRSLLHKPSQARLHTQALPTVPTTIFACRDQLAP